MLSWGQLDAIDLLKSSISSMYYKGTRDFADKLDAAWIWQGRHQRRPRGPNRRVVAARKKRSSSKPKPKPRRKQRKGKGKGKRTVSPSSVPRVTKKKKAAAQAEKQAEVSAAAAVGIRKSSRTPVSSAKLLAGRAK